MEARTAGAVDAARLARESIAAINHHDLSRLERYWGPDSVDHFVPVGEFRGRDALRSYFRDAFCAFPDLRIDIDRIVTDGSVATVQWRLRGTFTGAPFLGVEATGRAVEIMGCDVMEWAEDGTLRRNTVYYDGAEFARQIGMLPRRDSGPDRALTALFNATTKLRTRARAKGAPKNVE